MGTAIQFSEKAGLVLRREPGKACFSMLCCSHVHNACHVERGYTPESKQPCARPNAEGVNRNSDDIFRVRGGLPGSSSYASTKRRGSSTSWLDSPAKRATSLRMTGENGS